MRGQRFYRALLHLYPASFRHDYGEEMALDFARRVQDRPNPWAGFAMLCGAVVDVVGNAAAVHRDFLLQDLRYVFRTLRRAPGFAVTALLLVALGVGANTAAFSVADFVLLRPLPFPEPDRLVKVWETESSYSRMEASPANYRDWKRLATPFESLAAYSTFAANVVGQGKPQRLEGAWVTADLLPTLGVRPLLGRLFGADDDREGAPGIVLLSYGLWQRTFGGDPTVLGRTVRLDDEPHAVIGIMPPDFQFPDRDTLFWAPFRYPEAGYQDRNDNWWDVVGRLKPGVSIETARSEMELVAARLRQQYPENQTKGTTVIRLRDEVPRQSRLLLFALLGASVCVLLIACANLASLLLGRGMARRLELAVRAAIGAGRERIVRQLATEGLLLAVVGGLLGVGVAAVSVPLLARLVPAALPLAGEPGVHGRVLAFAVVLTALTGLAFSVVPALRVSGQTELSGLREGVRSGGGGKERLLSVLVISELAASVVLLAWTGLLFRTLWTIQATDPGFRAESVTTFQTALSTTKYAPVALREVFYRRVLGEVRALPGVDSGRLHQLPADGDARRGLARDRSRRSRSVSRSSAAGQRPLRHPRLLRLTAHSHPAWTRREPGRHGAAALHRGGERVVRPASLAGPRPDRPSLLLWIERSRGGRGRGRHSGTGVRAAERTSGVSTVGSGGGRWVHRVPAERTGGPIDGRSRGARARGPPDRPACRPRAARLRRSNDDGHRGNADRLARRAVACDRPLRRRGGDPGGGGHPWAAGPGGLTTLP